MVSCVQKEVIHMKFFDDMDTDMEGADGALLQAVEEKRYRTLYAMLDNLTEPLHPLAAYQLALAGLQCSIRAFRTILDHCPPLEEFALMESDPFDGRPSYLPSDAARLDRPEHLDELLRRGCDPNGQGSGYHPLAMAMYWQSTRCVKRLLKEPRLHPYLSKSILSAWAKVGLKGQEELSKCCRAVAPFLMAGEDISPTGPLAYQGVPIPRQLTVSTAVEQHNWPLAIYLCQRDGLSEDESAKAFDHLKFLLLYAIKLKDDHGALRWQWQWNARIDPPLRRRDMAALLNAFFSASPHLLRRRLPQTLLFITVLSGKRVPPELRPWLDQVRRGAVILEPFLDMEDLARILSLWDERLGDRWIPALDPKLSVNFNTEACTRESLETLLTRCRILNFRPSDTLTDLSILTLRLASIPTLIQQLQPGGLLAREDPQVLLDYCRTDLERGSLPYRINRRMCMAFPDPLSVQRKQAVLVHVKREVRYDL